ncbi:DUF4932 domain-containing protein [Planctomycetota bacterium]
MQSTTIRRVTVLFTILLGIGSAFHPRFASALEPGITLDLSDTISAEILPRVELLSGVLSHTTWINQRGPTGGGSLYYQALHDFFYPYRNHEAVQIAQTLTNRGFTYDAPPNFILRLSPLPALEAPYGYSDYLIQRAQSASILEQFRVALQDLAARSNFLSFCDTHRPLLGQTVQDAIADVNAVAITDWMGDFFGWSGDRFHLVFAPAMFPGGGYGASVETGDGVDIYQVVRASGYGTERPGFPSGISLTALTLHEFSHSFVNPSVEADLESFANYNFNAFYQQVKQIMSNQAYGSVVTFVNETLVRSVTTLALSDLVSPAMQDISIGNDRLRGFYLNDLAVHELRRYQGQRDLYERFDLFLPTLAAACHDHQQMLLAHSHIPFTLAEALQDRRPPAFIVPTAEANAVDANAIATYVQDVRDSLAPTAPVLTDQEALQLDMSPYFVRCYGTLTGNLWIREKLSDLPIVMEPNHVEADTTYPGTHLRFITTWPDPSLSNGYVVVYTAQQAQDIVGIHDIENNLPNAYVLIGPDSILRAGFYTEPSSGRRYIPADFERYPWRTAEMTAGNN